VAIALILILLPGPCLLDFPVAGPVIAPFSPVGAYGGHWGIDLAVPVGTLVRSAADGVVTFSGEIAGRSSVTVHHGGGVRTSYSYLASRTLAVGSPVGRGEIVGASGLDNGMPAVHFSLRIGDRYLDPGAAGCRPIAPRVGIRLAPAA
jgi:murein DD-endopeptidase MepM/ murein hydrolase activator NlpD